MLREEVKCHQFDLLKDEKGVKHGVIYRIGGVSKPPFDSLNTSFTVGDQEDRVKDNLEMIEKAFNLKSLQLMHQVHGKMVLQVDQKLNQEPVCDGMATTAKGLALAARHADCQPAIFFDPILKALSVVHCGWKGNVQNIYRETVELMKKAFGSDPKNLLVCIGPSLGPGRSEFIHYKKEFPESFWKFQFKPTYFDLWELSTEQLMACGVLKHHIEVAKRCTYEEKDLFFSYRRDRETGRNLTFASLV